MISKKVVLTGSFGVGKTSLFNRFISNTFSDHYLTTIGVKVEKKSLHIDGNEVSLIVWDIAGEVSQEKVPKSYFLGASVIIYVFDLSRPTTLKNMRADLRMLNELLPGVVIRKVGNKNDLPIDQEELKKMKKKVSPDIFTSAKTGENVEELFFDIAKALMS